MTKHKSFKGRVRTRMDKTSESYTTARRQLLAKAAAEAERAAEGAEAGAERAAQARAAEGPATPATSAAPAAPTPPGDAPAARRPYSDAVIQANTGKTWDEWFAVLDQWGAAERPHPEFEVRTARASRSIRANWGDGSTRLVINFTARARPRARSRSSTSGSPTPPPPRSSSRGGGLGWPT
jgi:hypothetical protein